MKQFLSVLLLLTLSLFTTAQPPDTVYYHTPGSIYWVSNNPNFTYYWNVITPGVIINGQSTHIIEVDWTNANPGLIPNAVSLYIIDDHGCISQILYLDILILKIEPEIWFYNAFTPNHDGTNDYWHPIGKGIVEMNFKIYNRWGELVFEGHNMNDKWNGKYKGMQADLGNYVFVAKWKDINNKSGLRKGNLILIR